MRKNGKARASRLYKSSRAPGVRKFPSSPEWRGGDCPIRAYVRAFNSANHLRDTAFEMEDIAPARAAA